MALFDELISDIGSRFSLGPKTEALLQELIRLIEAHPGGLGGFLDQFKNAGFGGQVASWLGDSASAALSGQEVETGLGDGVVSVIASKLGLGPGTVGDAIGYMLPKLVGLLTPGGIIPKLLPASVTGLLGGAPPLPKSLAKPTLTAAQTATGKSSAGLWAIPVVLLAVLGLLAYFVPRLHKEPTPVAEAPKAAEAAPEPAKEPAPAPAAPPPAAPHAAPAPAPAVPAQLKLERASGVLTYGGSVDSAESREAIVALLKSRFGADHIKGRLAVDPNVAPPNWMAGLKAALDLFNSSSWRAVFEGSSVDVGAPILDRDKIVAGLKSIFGSALAINAGGSAANAAGKPQAGEEQTASALAGLKPGFSGADLVAILNKYVVNFDTGSATISDASKPVLRQAAALIKKLPAAAKVHIDGYTDASGDAAANVVLSRRRAEAVRALLIDAGVAPGKLRAKGHGAAHSTEGDNRGDRRLEFSVQ
jgi:outer membrane protein OmpA-like peptidoglycan-associated protein/uncharacterized protein YidB (DUF937 family)